MSETATTELIDKLRSAHHDASWKTLVIICAQAADLLESQAAEIERLRADSIMPCGHHISQKSTRLESHTEFCEVCELKDLFRDAAGEEKRLLVENAELRAQLADAERQRDQAVELLRRVSSTDFMMYQASDIEELQDGIDTFLVELPDIDRPERGASSGEEPAARSTPKADEPGNGDSTGLSAASAACEPMTGQEMYEFWDSVRHGTSYGCRKPFDEIHPKSEAAWNALAAHIWPQPQPQPDRREQLRGQVKRTDFPEDLTVMELCGKCCTVAAWTDNPKDFRVVPSERGRVLPQQYYPEHRKAIAAATEWLIEQAMKGDGE